MATLPWARILLIHSLSPQGSLTPSPLWGEGRVRGGLYPARRRRAFEAQAGAAVGMHESEPRGVQPHPPAPISGMKRITQDRMADGSELDADLVPPPGAEPELERGGAGAAGQHAVVRDGLLALPDLPHPEGAVLAERGGERAGIGLDMPLDKGDIDALHGARLELGLQAPLGPRRPGEDEQARCVPVQPVHDEGPAGRLLRGQILPEQPIRRPLALVPSRGNREQPRRFVDHEQRVVFMDQAERRGKGGPRPPAQGYCVGCTDRQPAIPLDRAVDGDAPCLEPLLEAAPRGLGEELAEPLEKGHSFLSTPSGRWPRSRRVPRNPTVMARRVATGTPVASTAGSQLQAMPKANRRTAQASAAASAVPHTPAAAPSSAYSTTKTRAIRPRLAPRVLRITEW